MVPPAMAPQLPLMVARVAECAERPLPSWMYEGKTSCEERKKQGQFDYDVDGNDTGVPESRARRS